MERFRINRLGTAHLRGDLFGGLTAGIVALPLALAFGVASGAGPVAGLYGAVCVGLFAALFGGTPAQISGPTGPMTIVAASVFTMFGSQPAVAFTVVMMAGAFQVLFGWLRLGRYVNLMPYPVISGFMTGIGCILIIMQLDPLLGFATPQSVINALTVLPGYLAEPNPSALVIGALALALVLFTPKSIGRIVPSPLIAIIVCSLAALPLDGAPLLGEVPTGLPVPQLPQIDFALLNEMLVSAAVLAALGSVDSLLTSLVADNVTRTYHDSDKELVGQGIGNLVAGVFGGIPGAGATIRTLSNVHAGGRTPLSGVVHAVALLAIVLGLGPLVAYVPHAALAGILIKVGIDVIDWRFLKRAHRAPRMDAVLMAVVLVLTVFVDVITAVGVGIVMASLAFVKEMAELQVQSIKTVSDPDHERMFDADTAALMRANRERIMFLHLSGLISFGAANELVRKFSATGSYELLIIDLLDVPKVDGSAALALEEVIQQAADARKTVFLVGLTYPVARLMGRLGCLELVRETERFESRPEAVRAAVALLDRGLQAR
ncbi:MAG: SulP family inorganic anion transporter [Xanthomonadales bacterium]|nr:SulP family inorganic anion transporter [Xanthomonadales bacterium]